jgi:hypothetical protein
VRLHLHSAPKTGIVTACGRAVASAIPPTAKRSAMTPSILDLRQTNSITKLRVQRAKLVHAFGYPLPQAARLHDLSIRRDYVVMTDHPACYDFVKEATECRCSSRDAQYKGVRSASQAKRSVGAPLLHYDHMLETTTEEKMRKEARNSDFITPV